MEVGQSLVTELDPEIVLHEVLEVARELTGARYAALGILDDERRELERFLTAGIDEHTREQIGALPRGRGVLGVLITDPRPLRLSEVGSHPRSYGFPPAHPQMKTFLGVPLVIRGEAWGNLYLTEKEGGEPFTDEDEAATTVLANWASIAVQNARLYQAIEGRRAELERAVRGLEATTEISVALGGETELPRVLELIAKRARALVESRCLLILLQELDQLEVAVAVGEVRTATVGTRIPLEGSIAGEVLRSGQPMRVIHGEGAAALLEEMAQADTALAVPLIFRGRGLGVIIALDRLIEGPGFRPEDESLLVAFAASGATAVHTARSVADERLRHVLDAAEQERTHWARELHDETLQGLGGLHALLSSALATGDPRGIESAVRDAVEQTKVEIQNLRSLITELRPAALDELGLKPALESLAERTRTLQGMEVETEIDLGEDRLRPELESTIYRVVQESLTNAAKHADASRVGIRVSATDGSVAVVVSDDGKGFDTAGDTAGFGLRGMRERMELLGGSVEIESASPGGTTVTATIPLR